MRIEFYFDFSCPFAYIASTQIEAIARDHGAELVWRPMLLGGVFRSIARSQADRDGPMATLGPAKARHNALDIQRWADHYDVELTMPAAHPMRTVRALRALLSLPEPQWPSLIHAIYRAYWQRGDDITAPEVLERVLREVGIAGDTLVSALAANDDPAIKAELRRRTDEAVARGVFGAPSTFVHTSDTAEPVMFWGQDRLHMVKAVLDGWRPGEGAPAPEQAVGDTVAIPSATASESAPYEVHFWYDFSSPFAYLGSTQIARVAAETGARLRWRPMLLGGLFREIGMADVPLFAMPDNKRVYISRDLDDWASYWDVPFRFAGKFPQRTITALRLALLAEERIAELSHALFREMWVADGDLESAENLARILDENGFDSAAMLAATRDPAVKQRLIDNTREAAERGVFGAPTVTLVDSAGESSPDRLYWGQDRLQLVADVLRS